MRSLLPWALSIACVGASVAACASEAELPKYGPPGGLYKKEPPQPTGTTTVPTTTGDSGGPPIDAGPCAVSFKTQIHPFMTTGNGKCSQTGCHATGGTPPAITSDANATHAVL